MKRNLALIFLALVLSVFPLGAQYKTGVYAQFDDSENVAAFKKHVSTLSSQSMEGRLVGSEGELMSAEYVTEVLKSYGVDVLSGTSGDLFGIRRENGDTLTSRNVCAFIQGADKSLRNKYIVIGARLDNIGTSTMTIDGEVVKKTYYGANGNASGIAMMLELARMMQTNRLLINRSVLFVAFGASTQTFAGSWYFLNRAFSDVAQIDAMINLDMVGTGTNGFYAFSASNADMNSIVTTLSRELQPVQPQIITQPPYPSDYISFYTKEIPSMTFTTGKYPEHDTDKDIQSIIDYEAMEKELEYVYRYSVALCNGQKPLFNPSDALSSANDGTSGIVSFYDCDTKPTFLGSPDPRVFMEKWVYSYLKYPSEAVEQGIQGKVLVSFIISENGKVKDVKVLRGVSPALDAEALKVVAASPDWKPGRVRGKKVKAQMSVYVEFRLEKKRSSGSKK